MPGGVNSPVRAFGSVGGTPVFMKKGSGAWLWDEDGNRYIDYITSWGPAIVGHAHPEVLAAIHAAVDDGLSFGTPTARESILASAIMEAMPNIEMIRLVSSGTEACMSALRVARAFTGRTKILKFEGCYHGHADMLLVKPGSGAATLGLSGSPGVPEETARHTLTARFNDIDQVREVFKSHGDTLAAIILEPIVGNAGFIRPVSGFLEELRSLCDHHGTLLIFDEVMTGFRVARGGCQQLSGIKPDMTVLGKVIGGGLPVGAYGGRREIMQMVAPAGPVYQAGTLSGNPVAVASGIKTLEILSRPGAFETLAARSKQLVTGFKAAAEDAGIPLSVDYEGGMFGFFFSKNPVRNYDDAKGADLDLFKQFFQLMLDEGIYLAPSAFEAGFLSLQHSVGDIEETVAAAKRSFAALAKQRSAKANS
ncbi:MAG: hypothetical protein RIQ81_2173 [Pseudomonadota bacterium]